MFRRALTTTATLLALSFGATLPAKADLVIQGRAAQALHCAALLYMVADELYQGGYISGADYNWAQGAAVQMLAYVPGTDAQKVQAMGQRFEKIFASRSLPQLMNEFDKTAPWCQQNFL
ncbi:MAG: hypothetical protein IAE87_17995 [Rhodobacteraceae bacterium]|jgi:hypothetical protein|nr:hypothetical protein [Paracoccaceae bacterium]